MKDGVRAILVILWLLAATSGHTGIIGDTQREDCDLCGGLDLRAAPGGSAFQWEKAVADAARSLTPAGPDLLDTMEQQSQVAGLRWGLVLESDVLIPVSAHPASSGLIDLRDADVACVNCADPAAVVNPAMPVPLGSQFSLLALMATTLVVFGIFIVRVVRALQRMREETLAPYLERHRHV